MSDAVLVITKVFNASVEDVFDAWIDPEQIAAWYGPEGFTNDVHTFEVKEGGTYRLTMNAPDGKKHPLKGQFITINRPSKLVFTWQWEKGMGEADDGRETTVTVEFTPVGDTTEMTMTHAGFVSEKSKQMHNQGWSSSFNKLEKILV